MQGTVGAPIPRHYRAASTAIVITVVEGFLPFVTVTSLTPLWVNPQDRPRFAANCTMPPVGGMARLWFQWGARLVTAGGGSSPLSVGGLFLTPLSQWYSVAVREFTLAPGQAYTFTLTATDVSTLSASASLHIEVNAPPASGRVDVVPAAGFALVTGVWWSVCVGEGADVGMYFKGSLPHVR